MFTLATLCDAGTQQEPHGSMHNFWAQNPSVGLIVQDWSPFQATDPMWLYVEVLTRQTRKCPWLLLQSEKVKGEAPGPTHCWRTAPFPLPECGPSCAKGTLSNGYSPGACLGFASRWLTWTTISLFRASGAWTKGFLRSLPAPSLND